MLRFSILLLVLCGFLVFSAGPVLADDISDLKEQVRALQETINNQQKTIESLNSKVQAVESKQQAQAVEVKKVPELAKAIDTIKNTPSGMMEGASVGGHLKFALLDRTEGERNGTNQHTKLSGGLFGSHNLYLTFSKEMSDWLKLDVRTETDVSASATPSLGSDITRTTSSSTSTIIDQAYMTALLSNGYELKVGKIYPMFSEDYSKGIFWHELYNMNKGTCSLQAWHDFGAELYKNIDFDKWSLPMYFSVLNGGTDTNVDNNENKAVLFHIAPEFLQTKLRLLGSLGYGKWDDSGKNDMIRALYGFDWKYKKFNLYNENIWNMYKNVVLVTTGVTTPVADGAKEGYIIRGSYTFNPTWRAVIEQSYANVYKTGLTGQKTMVSDKYYSTSLALDYSLTPSSTIITQYEHVNGARSDGSDKLMYNRITMGWRTTF